MSRKTARDDWNESRKRFLSNFEYVIEKYDQPFENDAEIDLRRMEIVKNADIFQICSVHAFGKTLLPNLKGKKKIYKIKRCHTVCFEEYERKKKKLKRERNLSDKRSSSLRRTIGNSKNHTIKSEKTERVNRSLWNLFAKEFSKPNQAVINLLKNLPASNVQRYQG